MKTKYTCPLCGGTEFFSQLSRQDIYKYDETRKKICYVKHEYVDEQVNLFCRDCCEEMQLDDNDIMM